MASSDNVPSSFKVGSIVRAPRSEGDDKLKGLAMVATIQDDHSVCLLWEPCIPMPLHNNNDDGTKKAKFLVAPSLPIKASSGSSQEEIIMDPSRIQPLLDFEMETNPPPTTATAAEIVTRTARIQFWKERADQLLRLGDPTSAIPYYEMALKESSVLSIGSSVICSIQGFPKLAEVDCVDEDSVDVVYIESGEETTIPSTDIILAILESDDKDHLQERILLNLARCLLQHSDIDAPRRSKYLKSAVLACTLALSLSSFHGDSSSDSINTASVDKSSTAQTALILRVKAQMCLSKWPHASADAKRLLQLGNQAQGRKLLENIEREKKQQAKRDKKLVKAVSRWVQTATSESVSSTSSEQNQDENTVGTRTTSPLEPNANLHAAKQANKEPIRHSTQPSFLLSSPFFIMLALTAAFLIQKVISQE